MMMNKPIKCIMATRGVSTDVNGSWRPCCRYDQFDVQEDYLMPWMKTPQEIYFDSSMREGTNGSFNDLYNSKEMIKLRKALANGIKVPECKSCWQEEDAGNYSYRQSMNDWYSSKGINVDINKLVSDPPIYIDLKLSNVCNLMCRMCSPIASSKIQKEEIEFTGFSRKMDKAEKYWSQNKIIGTKNEKDFIKWLPTIKAITFTGGDPMVGKENRDVLQLIIDKGYANNIDVYLNTNGMLMSKPYIKLLKHFHFVSIAFSIDDIGDRLYYHRSGANFEKFLENWNKLDKLAPKIQKHIYITVCNYNIWYILDAYKELKKMTNYISYDFVHGPKELNISYLHNSIKHQIIEKYKDEDIKVWRKLLNFIKINQDEDLTFEFHKHIKKYDKRRNEKFEEVYPEWSKVIMYG